MEPDEIKKYGLGCCIVMLVGLGLMFAAPFLWRAKGPPVPTSTAEDVLPRTVSAPAPAPVPKKTPLQMLEALSYAKDPAPARELALQYFRDGSDEEKRAALKVLPSQNLKLFEEAHAKRDLNEARKICALAVEVRDQSARLDAKDVPPGLKDGIRYMKERIQEMSVAEVKATLASGDAGSIDAAIEAAWKDPEGVLPEEETLDYLAAAWNRTADNSANPGAAATALQKAADFAVQDVHSISYWKYRSGPLEQALSTRYSYPELMASGRKSLQSAQPVLALAYLSAAIKASSSAAAKMTVRVGTTEWLERQRLLCEAMVDTAALAEDGKLRWLPPDANFENKVEILLQMAARYADDADRLDKNQQPPETKYAVAIRAWDELLRLYRGKLHRLARSQEPHRIVSYCDGVLYESAGAYVSFIGRCFGPEKVLASVPESSRKELEKKAKSPQDRLFALSEMIRLKAYSPPFAGKEEFVKASMRAKYDMGTAALSAGKYPEAFMYFREMLRECPESDEAAGIRKQIVSRIDEARKSRDFNAVYYLASFMIGEMQRLALPEDLNRKLADCLEDAADFYKTGSPMKRAFMLSLLSDVLAGTEKGIRARDEAMKIGFDAVKQLPFRDQEKPPLVLPSLVKGCSVDAVRNSTPYHLMAFYDGPEKFFVRLNPYSRGSLALLDGEYEIAVIVTSDSVTPYRTKARYAKEFFLQNYFIAESGRTKADEYPDRFMGDFSILRLPKSVEDATVEPESGVILQNRP